MIWVILIALIIGFWILWATLCYNLAAEKNRNTGWAIFWGAAAGIFAVLYYATVSKIEKESV